MQRRDFLRDAAFATGAAITPSWLWRHQPADRQVARTTGRQVGMADVDRVRAAGGLFGQMDQRYGGGHTRWLAVAYLDREVAPLLHGSYTERVGRELFAAAAMLTRRAGLMAYDAVLSRAPGPAGARP